MMVRRARFRFRLKKKERGVALITALLIVSLATIMAVSLMSRQYMDIRRTGNIMSSDKAYLQALTMEISSASLLKVSRQTSPDHFDDKKAFEEAVLGINANAMQVSENEAKVNLELVYPEALFNVNTLLKPNGNIDLKRKTQFKNLMDLVLEDLGLSIYISDNLVDSLVDWIDADDNVSPNGAEDSTYESKDPPYKTANQIMQSISELQLVEGFDKTILYGIPKDEKDESSEAISGVLHYVTALPLGSAMNVNLVTEPKIIQSISPDITDVIAKAILAEQPFNTLNDFTGNSAWDAIKDPAISNGGPAWTSVSENITAANPVVQSTYFVAKSTASLGKSIFILNSLVFVDKNGTKLEVISRAIGTDGI
ncbi:MAG: type II secretion system minor pseudopilin GspK [Gammaproteobacteria bacterium]|nr:type II secretion system minor pseudopilin GspK [Gammaproteobacteria bacterium]